MQHSVLLLLLSCCVAAALAADSPFNATLVSAVVLIVLLVCAIIIAAVIILVLWMRMQKKEGHVSEEFNLQESRNQSTISPSHARDDKEEEEEKLDLHYSSIPGPSAVRSSTPDHSFTSEVVESDRYVSAELNHNAAPAVEHSSDLRSPEPSTVSEDFSLHVYTDISRKTGPKAGKKPDRRPPPPPAQLEKEEKDGDGFSMATELLQAFEKGKAREEKSVAPPAPAQIQSHPPPPPAKPKAWGEEQESASPARVKPAPPAKPKPYDPPAVAAKLKPVPPAKPKPEQPPVVPVKLKPTPPVKPAATTVNEGGKPQPPSKPVSTPPADSGGPPKPRPRPTPAPRQTAEVQSPKPLAKPRVPAKPWGGEGGVANGGVVESDPVAVGKFGVHVASLHTNNNAGFIYQYDALPSGEEGHLITDGISPEQSSRNRFHNIVPYNDNRIKLKPIPGQNSYQHNYINASYIDGLSSPHKYIATQGPPPATVVDFWRLVWQEKVPTIAMLTNLSEQGNKKCERYWPEYGTVEYGPYTVTLAEQQVLADYTFSTLELQFNARGGRAPGPRKILHLQFTSWPDQDSPQQAGPLLVFFRRLRALHVPKNGPLLVHCSAGVGRTGTLLAISLALEQAGKDGQVDVPFIVTNLRKQRMKMVQSQEQYMFIHDAILEQLICGDTHISTPDLRRTVEKLKQEELKDGKFKTGYAIQFDVLEQVSPKPKEVLSQTAQLCPTKNRTMEFLPSDSERVALKRETPGYIHASFANGYKKKNAFIIAQAPMGETCRDFWKMVYERECGVIVMLSELVEEEKEMCVQYWARPGDRNGRKYAEYSVHTTGAERNSDYTTRRMVVHDSRTGQEHQVVQFQIPVWAADGTCSAPMVLVDTIHQIAAAQRKSGNKPIVVHGSDTVSRCGVFCALMNAIECCKTEGAVDVFQAVKALRLQKPGSVHTLAQYQSLFHLMVTFLDSFDTYANFK